MYQISSIPNETNVGDIRHFSRSYRRRLPAEVMNDAVTDVVGVREKMQGLPQESRAMLTWNNKLKSEFLDTFGRPDSSADCPCEREMNPTMTQALHLMNSEKLQAKLDQKSGRIAELAKSDRTPEQIVEELYLSTFCRMPTAEELALATAPFMVDGADRNLAASDVAWALMNSAEFVFNH